MIPKIVSILSPILIGLLPILFLFQKNPGEVWFTDFLFLTCFLIIVILCALTIFFLIKKNLPQASLSTILMILPLSIVNESYPYHVNVLIWSAALIAGSLFLFINIKSDLLWKIQQSIFIPLLFLSIIFGISIINSKNRIAKAENELKQLSDLEFSALKKTKKNNATFDSDVYFFILDELISPVAFRNYYHYDNENFFSFLKSSGFHLARYSYSNYPWTIPSISSIVSLNYHKNWVQKNEFPQIAHFLLKYNMAAKLLEAEGYRTYSIPSIYWFGNDSKGSWKDFLFRSKSYGLTMSVLRSTPLANKMREYQRIQHKRHIHSQLAQIEEISKKKEEKKFVFTHFLCPHRPIVFDKDGKDIEEKNINLAETDKQHQYYLNQAYFISNSIQKLVEKILASSTSPPLIVIVSDHGKFPIGSSGKGKTTLPLNELSWRLSNFIAFLFPSSSIEIPELVTVVNVFRMLLSHYFGYNLPSLPDICHTDFFDLEKEESTHSLLHFQYMN